MFGYILPGFIPGNAAHMAVKGYGRQVIGIAAAEEPVDSLGITIFTQKLEGSFAQALSLIAISDVQMIQTDLKILVSAVMIRAKREIPYTFFSIQEQKIMISVLPDVLRIPLCIQRKVIIIQHSIGIDATVGFLPDRLSCLCQ